MKADFRSCGDAIFFGGKDGNTWLSAKKSQIVAIKKLGTQSAVLNVAGREYAVTADFDEVCRAVFGDHYIANR